MKEIQREKQRKSDTGFEFIDASDAVVVTHSVVGVKGGRVVVGGGTIHRGWRTDAGRFRLTVIGVFGLGARAATGSSLAGAAAARGAVRLDVLRQVVGAHEALAALGAGEPLLAGVRPQVALQFVAPREALAAEQPLAAERPLARVPPQVRLEKLKKLSSKSFLPF